MASDPIIYRHPTHHNISIPDYDILTFLFDSEHATAQPDSTLHLEAADPDNAITTTQLRSLTERISHGLRHSLFIGSRGPGRDVVTVITYGQILAPALLFGIIGAGGVYSAASPSSTVAELSRQIEIGQSRWIVCGEEHRSVAVAAARARGLSLRNVLLLDSTRGNWRLDSLEGNVSILADDCAEQRLAWPRITDRGMLQESLVVLIWSSGTTGPPKGVKLSHRNLVAETYILFLRGREMLAAGTLVSPLAEGEQGLTLAHLPIAHISGLSSYMLLAIYNNARVAWMRQFKFDELLVQLRRYKVTSWYTVPSIWLRLTKTPGARGLLKHVVGVSTGAAAMDGALMQAVNDLVAGSSPSASTFASPPEPVQIAQTWGLSETTGAVTGPDPEDRDDSGSISHILPTMEIRLVDDAGADIADPSTTPGELLVRGPVVTRGYFGNANATRDAFTDDGEWFRSGDVAVRRGGRFYIVDRKKELLKYKGLQIAPAELENVLFQHPGIREAAVVGVPAPNDPGTDWPRAYIVKISPSASREGVTANEVRDYIAARLAPYKQLRGGVVFVDEIPKNAVGKFLRRELRERAKKEMAGSGQGATSSKL